MATVAMVEVKITHTSPIVSRMLIFLTTSKLLG